ncbi:Fic family protein [Sediminivirga luteola]|uniref:Fic family protein n=2 Tax=Sediminivirga luteola TaxID=1774748 RepID=A0A8J2TZL0_9MICO|nr:Fic family protein [Sediminivirga luteola]
MRGNPWPRVGFAERRWVPTASAQWGVRAEETAYGVPYRWAIVPHIAELTPSPSPDVVAKAEEAERELTRFDAELGARVSGFAPVLLRSEAVSSSQIENLTASARAIFSAELGAKSSRNAGDVAANAAAMRAALDLASDPSSESIRQMHTVLMEKQPRHTPGQWRKEPVWIGTRSDSPVGAQFVGPDEADVPGLVDDLATFVRREDIPALIAVAVAHAQFETIHPFTDGNGRTGRALAQSMLRHRGVTRNVAVPVSAGLLADVEGYHAALTAYRAGEIDPIVSAFADASLRAVSNARQLAREIEEIRVAWEQRLTVRRSSNAWRLLDILTRRPVLNSAAAAEELGVKQPNVYPPLNALVNAGILKSKGEHGLGPFWRSDEILAAIDAFAARAGRRSQS